LNEEGGRREFLKKSLVKPWGAIRFNKLGGFSGWIPSQLEHEEAGRK